MSFPTHFHSFPIICTVGAFRSPQKWQNFLFPISQKPIPLEPIFTHHTSQPPPHPKAKKRRTESPYNTPRARPPIHPHPPFTPAPPNPPLASIQPILRFRRSEPDPRLRCQCQCRCRRRRRNRRRPRQQPLTLQSPSPIAQPRNTVRNQPRRRRSRRRQHLPGSLTSSLISRPETRLHP